MILSSSFYQQDDVVLIARQLLGKVLCTSFEGKLTSGIITETEAYAGKTDRASHAFNGRRTERTEIMYRAGGISYVYLCYGVHSLFNVVTSTDGDPQAVLIRSIFPFEGLEYMQQRISGKVPDKKSGIGPGKLTRLLGIHYSHTGIPLVKADSINSFSIWIEDRRISPDQSQIISGPRIGVDYAGEDALLPYRFRLADLSF